MFLEFLENIIHWQMFDVFLRIFSHTKIEKLRIPIPINMLFKQNVIVIFFFQIKKLTFFLGVRFFFFRLVFLCSARNGFISYN
jgi:hypothetical protein